jgi:DNA-binding transcriptional regulator YdaS (Cro superfamily)
MNLNTWLEAEKGRLTALAAHFALTPSAVSQWKTNGVPRDKMRAVRDWTDGAVDLEDMLPDHGPAKIVSPEVESVGSAISRWAR